MFSFSNSIRPNFTFCEFVCHTHRGPYYLGVYDLANIKETGALFIRKVAKEVDPNLFQIFPVERREDIPDIQWPEEVKINEKIDWKSLLNRKL